MQNRLMIVAEDGVAHSVFIHSFIYSFLAIEKCDQMSCKTVNTLRTNQKDMNLLISDIDKKIDREIAIT
jgi:hypothetical protein